MMNLEHEVPQQMLEDICIELNGFDYGIRELQMDDQEFIDIALFEDLPKNGIWKAYAICAKIMIKRYIDDDDYSLLMYIRTYETLMHKLDMTTMQKYDMKCLVRRNDMAQFIYDLLVTKKVDDRMRYKNTKKIRGSTYGTRLCDIDIILCDH